MNRISLPPVAGLALCICTLAPGLAFGLQVSAVCTGNVRLDGDGVGLRITGEHYGPGHAPCVASSSDAAPTGASGHAQSRGYASPGLQQAYSSALGEASLFGRPPEVTSAEALVLGSTEIRVVDSFRVTSSLVSPGSLLSVTLGYSVAGTVFSAGLNDSSGRGANDYSVTLVQGASVLAGSSGEQSYQFGTRHMTGSPGYRESTNDGSAFNGLREMTISVAAGSSIDLYINMRAGAFANTFAGGISLSGDSYTTADMGHSLTWAGISAVRDPGGNLLSEYSALSASSSFDYANAYVASVPETSTLAMLLAGLGVLHLRWRKIGTRLTKVEGQPSLADWR